MASSFSRFLAPCQRAPLLWRGGGFFLEMFALWATSGCCINFCVVMHANERWVFCVSRALILKSHLLVGYKNVRVLYGLGAGETWGSNAGDKKWRRAALGFLRRQRLKFVKLLLSLIGFAGKKSGEVRIFAISFNLTGKVIWVELHFGEIWSKCIQRFCRG